MPPKRFRRFLPDPQTLREHRALRWMGPVLHDRRLWHFNRRGVALGLALGVFFGLLMPLAQIFFAAMAALLLSDEGAFVTGQVISVDGGSTMRA